MKLIFIFFILFSFISAFADGGNKDDINNSIKQTDSSSSILYIDDTPMFCTFDSLYYNCLMPESDIHSWQDVYDFDKDSIPEYLDNIYRVRINKINATSPFTFQYNESVRRMIVFYSTRRQGLIKRAMARKDMYFPLFEQLLDKYQIPMELKYLAIVESALNPSARSRAGAQGLWQFMPGTGQMYGLHRNSRIDDRMNIYKSTEAACQHFCDLYARYHDWNLVLAAYNAGPGNVNKAIRRANKAGLNTTDYWQIRQFLPRETQSYVPAFIAVNYMMKYTDAHNIQLKSNGHLNYFDTDTVYISKKLTFKHLADWLEMDLEIIKTLNPQYRKNYIPARVQGTGKSYVLTLPNEKLGEFILNEKLIFSGISRREYEIEAVNVIEK